MGLSASQARYLQLTARRNDNEYEAQQINNARSEIAKKMQDISMKYTEGVNNRMLNFTVSSGDGTQITQERLTYTNITAEYPAGLGYQLVDKYGTEVRPNEKSATALRKEAVEELAEAPVATEENKQYIEETRFEVKPSLWQRIKESKIGRAIRYAFKIRVVLDVPALPEGRGEQR